MSRAAVARAAALADDWRYSTPADRSSALWHLADEVAAAESEYVEVEVAQTGKRRAEAESEVRHSIDVLRFFAGAARVGHAPAAGSYVKGSWSMVQRRPYGVVAAILPWNYPMVMAAWKVGPAIAAGNVVVLKPAEQTPGTAQLLARHVEGGLVQTLVGGDATGAQLVQDPEVDMVAFTGSIASGNAVAAAAGTRPTHLELGGNGPVIYLDADLDEFASRILAAAVYNSGQSCAAPARVLAPSGTEGEVFEALADHSRDLWPGDPDDQGASYGSMISEAQRDRAWSLVDRTQALEKFTGKGDAARPWLMPLNIIRTTPEPSGVTAVTEEVFAPVLTVEPYRDLKDAIDQANRFSQRLAASVWGKDTSLAIGLADRIDAGEVWINAHLLQTPELPHGGAPGHGHDLSLRAVDEFSTCTAITIGSVGL